MTKIVTVIPAYNESETIRDLAIRVLQQSSDLIVIDDGSSDGTGDLIEDLPLTLLRNECNQGKAASLWKGMQRALKRGADAILTLDADGQHLPEDIPRFLEAMNKYPNLIIIGSRLAEKTGIPSKRYYANKVANFWISWAAGYAITDSQSGFRLYPSALLQHMHIQHDEAHSFVFESEILIEAAKLGVHSIPLPISAIYQKSARASHFRPVLDIVRITRMVAWRLISRGLYLKGLYRGCMLPILRRKRLDAIGVFGLWTFILSNTVIVATLGISWLWQVRRALSLARHSKATQHAPVLLMVLGMRLVTGQLGQDFKVRLLRAEKLYRQHPGIKILILGGKTNEFQVAEAEKGREFLCAQGIPKDNIVMELNSVSTLDNLIQARPIISKMAADKVTIVSSRYHLKRADIFATECRIKHDLCAAEDEWVWGFRPLIKIVREAYYLHWYHTGKLWSRIVNTPKSIDGLS